MKTEIKEEKTNKLTKHTLKVAYNQLKRAGRVPSKHRLGHIPPLRLKKIRKANVVFTQE